MNASRLKNQPGFSRPTRSPHFWIILTILLVLIILYTRWPWLFWEYQPPLREWMRSLGYLALIEFKYKTIGSLFLIPLVYATIVFRWRGTLATWLVYLAVTMPLILSLNLRPESIARNTAFILAPLSLVVIVVFELKWRTNLAQREMERQKYTAEIFKAQENERRNISLELHDDVIQKLIGIANTADNQASRINPENIPEARRSLESIRDMVFETSEGLRKMSVNLRPSVLDTMGLVPALIWLVNHFRKESSINARISVTGMERKLGADSEVMIFRIVQEALANIKRHSKASSVLVSIEFSAERTKLVIQDNGCGFTIPEALSSLATDNKLGILGMKERAKLLNGVMDISSELGAGTTITIQAKC